MKKNKCIVTFLMICLFLAACERDNAQISDQPSETLLNDFTENSWAITTTFNEAIATSKDTDQQTTNNQNTTDNDKYSKELQSLTGNDLMICPPDENLEWAVSDGDDFEEARTKYTKLLEDFAESPENFKLFGGAYYQNGYFNLLITNEENSNIFLNIIGNKNIIVKECDYSYIYLHKVYDMIFPSYVSDYGRIYISHTQNRVIVSVSSEEEKASLYSTIEENNFDRNSVEIIVEDVVFANPL